MVDETEALKHNFILRGFFKRRGYYNLTHIAPDKYRTDSLFTSPASSRSWLSAEQLFVKGPSGLEQIAPAGKALLNSSLAQYGDSIVASPIIVEGYWGGNDPADQLILSRSRAILVRRYLQYQFQLDSGHLGAVPLKNLPPNGLDHSHWDGVCIVVLKMSPTNK
jgi:hypothetical protein